MNVSVVRTFLTKSYGSSPVRIFLPYQPGNWTPGEYEIQRLQIDLTDNKETVILTLGKPYVDAKAID